MPAGDAPGAADVFPAQREHHGEAGELQGRPQGHKVPEAVLHLRKVQCLGPVETAEHC